MTQFTTVARVGDIPEGQGMAYPLNGRMVAVFNDGGQYRAIDDFCPHMGASLAGGPLEDGIVTCPWHAWRFNTCDGTWCDNPRLKIDAFAVRVQGDEIQVCVPESQESEESRESSVESQEPESKVQPEEPKGDANN